MAKRFTDTEKWKRPKFRTLTPEMKLLWIYMTDNCDHAGVWIKDFDLASYFIGVDVKEEDAIESFKGSIDIIDDGEKWFIRPFIEFQTGTTVLNPKNNLHLGIIKQLKRYKINFEVLSEGLTVALKEKNKEKNKNNKEEEYKEEELEKDSLLRNKKDTIRRLYDHEDWHTTLMRNNEIDDKILKNHLTAFIKDQDNKDALYRPVTEIKSHFVSWLTIQLKRLI